MKKIILSIIGILLLGSIMLFAEVKTEKFEVKGNCGMCESRIEKAAKSVDGVKTADWNKENDIMEVSFDESKTSVNKIQKAIANVGHDTPMHKAKDEVYNALPGCCKYDREDTKKEGHEGHKH